LNDGPAIVSCGRCGATYSADAKFCKRCGASLHKGSSGPVMMPQMAAPSASYRAPTPPAPAAKRNRGWMAPLFAGAAALLFLAVAAPLWFVMINRQAPLTTSSNSNSPTPPTTNSNANNPDSIPELSFTNLTGSRQSLRDFRGQVVVLNYWSVSNVASRNEVPVINELARNFDPKDVAVIGIAVGDTADEVKQFQKQVSQNYLIGLQPGNSSLSTLKLPTTYLIDRSGRVRQQLVGPESLATLETGIKKLLNQ
jgi:peroxiredoxin